MVPRRTRNWSNPFLIAAFAAGAGLATGLLAMAASGPFAALATPPSGQLVRSHLRASPLDLGSLFSPPPRQVVHHVVDVYDLPPAPVAGAAQRPAGSAPPPEPASTPEPSANPEPGDDGD